MLNDDEWRQCSQLKANSENLLEELDAMLADLETDLDLMESYLDKHHRGWRPRSLRVAEPLSVGKPLSVEQREELGYPILHQSCSESRSVTVPHRA
jgi:hypothetical protein